MARHAPLLCTVVVVLAVAAASAYVHAADVEDLMITVGDVNDEFGLGRTISRRRLQDGTNATSADAVVPSADPNATSTDANATSGYISYDALRADSVPCTQRGASYYNCRPGAEANPYTRGCSAITQCRG